MNKRVAGEMPKMLDLRDEIVYSSVLLGPGAIGSALLFALPLGAPVSRLGAVPEYLGASASAMYTNMLKARELGRGFGDFVIRSIETQVYGATVREVEEIYKFTRFSLSVGDRRVFSNVNPGFMTTRLDMLIQIRHSDDLLGTLEIDQPFDLSGVVQVKVVLRGIARREVW